MNCPYCGTALDNNQVFCPKCGNRVVDHVITNTYEISSTKELETFIGPNCSRILRRGISIPSFFLGVYYFLYRKMYLLSIIFIILQLGICYGFYYFDLYDISKLTNNYIYVIFIMLLFIMINFIVAIKFNSMYIDFANKKINKIKNKNTTLTKYEIENKIKDRGGVNLLLPVLFILLFSISNFYINNSLNKTVDLISNNKYDVVVLNGVNEYLELNEDKSFIWYKNKNNISSNYSVGTYEVLNGKKAKEEITKYRINNNIDLTNFYLVKFKFDRTNKDGIVENDNRLLIYYGIYNDSYIDLNGVNGEYISLKKV